MNWEHLDELESKINQAVSRIEQLQIDNQNLLDENMKLRSERAIDAIRQVKLPINIVLGLPESIDGKLFNALTVLEGDSRLATYHKQ